MFAICIKINIDKTLYCLNLTLACTPSDGRVLEFEREIEEEVFSFFEKPYGKIGGGVVLVWLGLTGTHKW